MYVYNAESDEVRSVIILPTEEWGGEGILGANVAFGFLHRLPKKCCLTLGRYAILNSVISVLIDCFLSLLDMLIIIPIKPFIHHSAIVHLMFSPFLLKQVQSRKLLQQKQILILKVLMHSIKSQII